MWQDRNRSKLLHFTEAGLESHHDFISQTVRGSLFVQSVKQPQRFLICPPTKDLHLPLLLILLIPFVLIVIAGVRVWLVFWGDAWLAEPGGLQAARGCDVTRHQLFLRRILTFALWHAGFEQRWRRGESRRRRSLQETETFQFEKTLVPT